MPFDAVLVASRVMTAKEAKTSDAAKQLLVDTGTACTLSAFCFLFILFIYLFSFSFLLLLFVFFIIA
jgi:hypothetical protein